MKRPSASDRTQPLVDFDEIHARCAANAARAKALPPPEQPAATSSSQRLAPDRHPQQDFFLAQIFDAAPKDDIGSMEHPMFSLSKVPDHNVRTYEHNGVFVELKPSSIGLATIWDKDVLLYVCGVLVTALERGEQVSRTIRFHAYDLLRFANRGTAGKDYQALSKALERLRGTTIVTNIPAAARGRRIKSIFGLLDNATIVDDGRIEVRLNDWLFEAIVSRSILSLSPDYFRITSGLARRIYEIARKHCGAQATWRVSQRTLYGKTGATCTMKEFRRQLRELAEHDCVIDYRMKMAGELVSFRPVRPAQV
jgi:plasmid replication initiation protein